MAERTNCQSKFAHFTRVHPCFDAEAHMKYARIHLPVAPRCNVQCNYCTRSINKCENRPGVAEQILTPRQALKRLRTAVNNHSSLSVVGIAGPGDALVNRETFETFRLINKEFPHLIKCLSTNGLLLPDLTEKLVNLSVKTVTVTVNAVDPSLTEKIYDWVDLSGVRYRGMEGARILIDRQLSGIGRIVEAGIKVKVNTVLIPGVNDAHIGEVAREAAKRGASLMNVIPLIPLYKFKSLRPPTCHELGDARLECEKYIPQFRLCKMCRADACGIPGLDLPSPLNLSPQVSHY